MARANSPATKADAASGRQAAARSGDAGTSHAQVQGSAGRDDGATLAGARRRHGAGHLRAAAAEGRENRNYGRGAVTLRRQTPPVGAIRCPTIVFRDGRLDHSGRAASPIPHPGSVCSVGACAAGAREGPCSWSGRTVVPSRDGGSAVVGSADYPYHTGPRAVAVAGRRGAPHRRLPIGLGSGLERDGAGPGLPRPGSPSPTHQRVRARRGAARTQVLCGSPADRGQHDRLPDDGFLGQRPRYKQPDIAVGSDDAGAALPPPVVRPPRRTSPRLPRPAGPKIRGQPPVADGREYGLVPLRRGFPRPGGGAWASHPGPVRYETHPQVQPLPIGNGGRRDGGRGLAKERLDGRQLLANPPFQFMATVVRKMLRTGARATLVAPVWRAQPWWHRAVEGCTSWEGLPLHEGVFPHKSQSHSPPVPKWRVAVFRFDGPATRCRA